MLDKTHLPIKKVVPVTSDYRYPHTKGGKRKDFREVDGQRRAELIGQVRKVGQFFAPVFERNPRLVAVGRVALVPGALAKSHRPSRLFSDKTCPIIGVRGFGELFISVSRMGLANLESSIANDRTKIGMADLSTIESIDAHRPEDAVGPDGLSALHELLAVCKNGYGPPLKCRLFFHGDQRRDQELISAFYAQIEELNLPPPKFIEYAPKLKIFLLSGLSPQHIEPLASFVGTQALGRVPQYRLSRAGIARVATATPSDFPPPDPKREYPVIGLIDTGTNPGDPFLSPWIVARHEYVALPERDYTHGSFVAGLIVHSRHLNQNQDIFPSVSSRIVDVVAVPRDGSVSEFELLTILDDVLPKHPEVKVWNMSIETNDVCTDSEFSDLGMALDARSDSFGVQFVLAAGNLSKRPLRGWPPESMGDEDRICAPADSVRSIAVTSIAHADAPTTRVRRGQPSPFARRGPGPVFLVKPELAHYGGNCDGEAKLFRTGVYSIDGHGSIVEDVGTSFSTPIIASLLANVQDTIAQPISRCLAKALLVHAAANSSTHSTARDIRYRGFGVPPDLPSIISCQPWAATLIFEPDLTEGIEFLKTSFPIPSCLRDTQGALRADFLLTLVYDPPLDSTFGVEYCRTNIEASLGTVFVGQKGTPCHQGEIPLIPNDLGKCFEKQRIQHGFKWSPVKVFQRSIHCKVGDSWELQVKLLRRKELILQQPQRMALIATIIDPEHIRPVYNEAVALMNRAGWVTQDLQLRDRIRRKIR